MEMASKIYVVHHCDMIGAAIVAALKRDGYTNIAARGNSELDITDNAQIRDFFEKEEPEYVFFFADSHGGIISNINRPAELIYENLKAQISVIHNCYLSGVKKLLFMAGGCVYPRETKYPVKEEYFMTGKMEPTSEAYSTARAAGIVMCQAYNRQYGTRFIPAVLTNYYGPGDDYTENGHVLASVMRKMHAAKQKGEDLTLWGDGTPKRQFMYIGDMAEAAVLIMKSYDSGEIINIAGGVELSIAELSEKLRALTGFNGKITFDKSKPNGSMRKLLDNSKLLGLGFREKTGLDEGLSNIYQDFLRNGCE